MPDTVGTKTSFGTLLNMCNDMLYHEVFSVGCGNEEIDGSTWSLIHKLFV